MLGLTGHGNLEPGATQPGPRTLIWSNYPEAVSGALPEISSGGSCRFCFDGERLALSADWVT